MLPLNYELLLRGKDVRRAVRLPDVVYHDLKRGHETRTRYLNQNGVSRVRLPQDYVTREYEVILAPVARLRAIHERASIQRKEGKHYYKAEVESGAYRIKVD